MLTTRMFWLRPWHPGPQAADAADVQVDADAGSRGRVQGLDQFRVGQRIDLGNDVRPLALLAAFDLAVDQFQQLVAEAERRGGDPAVLLRHRVAGDGVEEAGGVGREFLVAGQEAHVAVQLGSHLVVVAGAEVDVALDPVRFAADDDADFGVRLEALDPVDHLDARLFEGLGPADVAGFVKAGLQLDQRRHVLARLRGPLQGGHDGAVAAGAVQDDLDRQHAGIVGGLLDQPHHRLEAFVRQRQQDILLLDRVEHARRRVHVGRRPWRPGVVLQFFEARDPAQRHQRGKVQRPAGRENDHPGRRTAPW